MVAGAWKELSVLIAGCGSIGKRHARILAELGVVDIRACDPVAAQLEGLCAETPAVERCASFEDGLRARPDCVWIMTPARLHVPMALQALDAGGHVFSEKPLCDRLDGLDDLMEALDSTDRKLMVGLCFRYHDGLCRAKELLEEGQVGRLISVRALMGEHIPTARPDYKQVWSPDGLRWGALDLTHDIDLAIWYAGQSVRRVETVYGIYSDLGMDAPDVAEILIEFEDRCCASVHLDFFQRPRRRQIELIGSEGVITVEFGSWDQCTVSVWRVATGAWEHDTMATDRDDMFRAEDREFLEAVADDAPITCTAAEALKSVQVVLTSQGGD